MRYILFAWDVDTLLRIIHSFNMKHIKNISVILLGLIVSMSFAPTTSFPTPLSGMLSRLLSAVDMSRPDSRFGQILDSHMPAIAEEYKRCFGTEVDKIKVVELLNLIPELNDLDEGQSRLNLNNLTLGDMPELDMDTLLNHRFEVALKVLQKMKDGSNLLRLARFAFKAHEAKLSVHDLGNRAENIIQAVLAHPKHFKIKIEDPSLSFSTLENLLSVFFKSKFPNSVESFVCKLEDHKLQKLADLVEGLELETCDLYTGSVQEPHYVRSNVLLIKMVEELTKLFINKMPDSFGTMSILNSDGESIDENPINANTILAWTKAKILRFSASNSLYASKASLKIDQRRVLYPASAEGHDLFVTELDTKNLEALKLVVKMVPTPYQYTFNCPNLTMKCGSEIIAKMTANFHGPAFPQNGDGLTHSELTDGHYGYVKSIDIPQLLTVKDIDAAFNQYFGNWLVSKKRVITAKLQELTAQPEELEIYKDQVKAEVASYLGTTVDNVKLV